MSQQGTCIENQILANLDHINQSPNSDKLDKPNYLFFYMILPATEQTFKSVKEILQKQTRQAGREKQKLDLFPTSDKDRFLQIQFSANKQAPISYIYPFI